MTQSGSEAKWVGGSKRDEVCDPVISKHQKFWLSHGKNC